MNSKQVVLFPNQFFDGEHKLKILSIVRPHFQFSLGFFSEFCSNLFINGYNLRPFILENLSSFRREKLRDNPIPAPKSSFRAEKGSSRLLRFLSGLKVDK